MTLADLYVAPIEITSVVVDAATSVWPVEILTTLPTSVAPILKTLSSWLYFSC